MPAKNTRSMSLEGLSEEYLAKRAELPLCVRCERPMRPAGQRTAEWPATVAYATTDQCKSCYNRKYVVSAAAALKQTDGVKGVKLVKARVRGMETTVPRLDLPKQEIAANWTAEERSAVLQICNMTVTADIPFADNVPTATHLLDMLGLLDAEKMSAYGLTDGPKGVSRFI